MLITIIVGALCLFIGYAFGLSTDECPRMIMGYNCRGNDCNHSKNEVAKAKKAMEKRS